MYVCICKNIPTEPSRLQVTLLQPLLAPQDLGTRGLSNLRRVAVDIAVILDDDS